MKKSLATLLAAACVLATAALLPGAAAAAPGDVSVSISAPTANSFHKTTPNLNFTTTGTGLLKTCTLTGNGADITEEACSSGWNAGPLADGTYTYGISVEKSSTGEFASASRSFKIDGTVPVITITGAPAAGASNGSVVNLTGSTADANPAFFNCRIDENPWSNCVGNTASGGGFDLVNVAEGEHTYWFAATDKAGNIGYASRTATLDRTPPSASIAGSGFTSETRDNTPAFLVGATDAFSSVAQRTCSIDGVGTWQACDGSAWLPADALADGTYTARIDAVDAAGNHGTASTAFTIDATLPLITYGGFTGDRTTEATPGIEFWASDAHSVTTRCAYDPAGWDALADCAQGSGHAPAAPLALGQHQFWITATDSFGNVASAIYSFEVVEPTKPGDGQSGGNGQTGGQTGGAPAVTVKAASSKVRRGKFTLTVTVTATNLAACANAAVSVAPKVKKVKPLSARPAAKSSAGACVAVAKFKLAAKLKGKKAAITGAQGGASKRLTVKL